MGLDCVRARGAREMSIINGIVIYLGNILAPLLVGTKQKCFIDNGIAVKMKSSLCTFADL